VGGIAASGRLRDFILGAIVQHYPLTLARRFDGPAPDFRAPTVDEIDALEAFMLSIGRQQDLDLNVLTLKDPGADAGKILFRDGNPPGSVTCNNCHGNAGANVQTGNNPGNRNFNTGVELFLRNRLNDPNITVIGEPRPVDGGFGTNPSGGFNSLEEQPEFSNENFGNQTFNTVSLVEAADSAPFFHNNIIANLEDAITFYNSPEFAQASGNSIPFNAEEVTRVANFLRVINALDNIENLALPAASRAGQALALNPNPDEVINRILQIAIADTQDAIDVLEAGNIHNSGGLPDNAVKQLGKAVQSFQQVMNIAASDTARNIQLSNATTHLNNAVSLMRF
jgi:cytochrome c peroxidase